MYKLMVVDDEQIVIDAVKHIVKNEISTIEVSQIAKSGREAIEKARLDRPDIVLMDIRMPGINGLEAVKELKRIHNNIKFVIVSAYEYFEFAKQAVELEVKDYLLKPVNKTRLLEVLQKLVLQLDTERKRQDQELESREKIDKMLSVVGHGFIYSLMLSQKADICKYKELFEMKGNTGYIFVLTFKTKDSGDSKIVHLGESVQNQKLYSFLADKIRYKCKAIIGPIILDRVVAYIEDSAADAYEQRVGAIAIAEDILKSMEKKIDLAFRIGIGSVHTDEDIMISYQEALKALNYSDEQQIIHIEDIASSANDTGYEVLSEINDLVLAVEKGDKDQCITIITDIFNRSENAFEDESLRNRLLEVMVIAHRFAVENDLNEDEIIEYSKYISQVLGCKNNSEFKQIYIRKISHIASRISESRKIVIHSVVEKANEIIEKRFSSELTLEDISKELCISPQYFSRLYKSHMGKNFIEQLTILRVKNAKKLMKKGGYSIKEICYMSGYSDPNYFSRLFKKYEGVSPTTYLKEL